ncbi:hypothetical protein EC973_003187 [Apophysomyces ossiformis]|uniref:Uncharacterized protein n=1 Tax=Apophysomyces ossiformis TaxID=679940 RepID=A0A8H7EQP2_9FUNG|nr:hypothetical protein EC973_003187 [Apophysomyces ossiformis]
MDPLSGYNYLFENNDPLGLGNPTDLYLFDPPVNQQHMTNMNEIRANFPPDDVQQPQPLQHPRPRRRKGDLGHDGMLYVLSSVGKILYCSDSCAELTGYYANELVGLLLTDYVHMDDLESLVNNLNISFHTQSQITLHYRFRKKDETYILLETIGLSRPSERPGQPPSFFGIVRPYSAAASIDLLESFLDLKMENELLRKRLREVTTERDETMMALQQQQQQQHQHPMETIPGTNSSTSSQTSRRASSILYQMDDNSGSPWPDRRQSISTIDDSLMALGYPSEENNNKVQIETSDSARASFAPIEEGVSRKDKWRRRKKTRESTDYICADCGTTASPEWRKGPQGPKTDIIEPDLRFLMWSKDLKSGMLDMIRQPVTPELLAYVTHQASLVIPCERLPEDQYRLNDLPSLPTFVNLLVKRSSIRAGTLLGLLVFLDRLQRQLSPIAKGMPCTCHRIFLATLIVTSKSLHDSSPKNKHWAKYAIFFDLSEVALMEIQLLSLMNYRLSIAIEDLYHVYAEYESFCHKHYSLQASLSVQAEAYSPEQDDENVNHSNEVILCRPSLIRVHSEATSSSSLTSNPDSVSTPTSLHSPVSGKPEMFYPEPPLFYPTSEKAICTTCAHSF